MSCSRGIPVTVTLADALAIAVATAVAVAWAAACAAASAVRWPLWTAVIADDVALAAAVTAWLVAYELDCAVEVMLPTACIS